MKLIKGFTATHGLENAGKGPYFWWKDNKVTNSMTTSSWHHHNFILEYEELVIHQYRNPNQVEMEL